jgi:F0F1-type ATP synthase assembly protein I
VVSDDDDATINAWTLVGLGGFLVGSVVLGLLAGWFVDDLADTSPVGILVGLCVGVVVAVVGSCVRIASYLRR